MEWIRAHPYVAASGAAGFLLIIGAAFVESKREMSPSNPPRVWSGGGQSLLNPSSYTQNRVLQAQLYLNTATDTPIHTTITGNSAQDTKSFSFEEIIAAISEPRVSGSATTEPTDTYSFIPGGLISTTTKPAGRSDSQQALYNYGNDAGSYIQSYEDRHRNAPVTLRDQVEDRNDPQKAEAVREIGGALMQVGRNLEGMEEVPAAIRSAHALLAKSYTEIGGKLQKVPDAAGDEAFITTITEYNSAVDTFTKRYVAVALLLSAHGVIFAPYESGSVFTFTNAGL